MNLIEKENLHAIMGWTRKKIDGDEPLNKRERELIELLDVLLHGCTPYLGRHGKVEAALAKFKEQMIP